MKPVLKRDETSAPMVRSRSILTRWNLLVLLLVINGDNGASTREDRRNLRPNGRKKRCKNPKIVVFGDSTSDSGRRFKAPASFDFGGIGAYPWETMYSANDTEEKFGAYLPSPGADTNGKVWPEWLRIPEELNFATSSASMTSTYRSKDICTGYTGQGDQLPTGTFMEQIESYFNYIADSNSNETLDYTHIIELGANDIEEFFAAVQRYQIGQSLQDQGIFGDDVYEDPVAFDRIFEIVDGSLRLNVEPLITEIITELSAGVQKLLSYGVTGRIVIANIPSFRPFLDLVPSGIADIIDGVAVETSLLIKDFIRTSSQLRQLDVYTLLAAVVDNPRIFEDLGFYNAKDAPDENPVPLAVPCLQFDFISDSVSEVMGTQMLRAPDCRRECALCADGVSPCQNCFLGNPSATVCDDPGSRIFWDSRHPTTGFHQLLGEAISQCTKDQPDYDQTLVQILCPDV